MCLAGDLISAEKPSDGPLEDPFLRGAETEARSGVTFWFADVGLSTVTLGPAVSLV